MNIESIKTSFKSFDSSKQILQIVEMFDKYVLIAGPSDWDGKETPVDMMYAMDKNTGKIYGYSPVREMARFRKAAKTVVNVYNPSLKHYGVKGQHWGERQWQYEDGSLTPEGYIHYGYGKSGMGGRYTNYMAASDSNRHEVAKNEDGTYTAAAKYVRDNKECYSGNRGVTLQEAKDINPDFGKPGTTNNCTKCTAALELVNRGYTNLNAGRAMDGVWSEDAFPQWFKGAEVEVGTFDSVQSKIESYGPNASGGMSFKWDGVLAAHEVYWTSDANGKVTIVDGQAGEMYDGFDDFKSKCAVDMSYDYSKVQRLDKAEVNWDALADDSVVRVKNNSYVHSLRTDKVSSKYEVDSRYDKALNEKVSSLYEKNKKHTYEGEEAGSETESGWKGKASDTLGGVSYLSALASLTNAYLGVKAAQFGVIEAIPTFATVTAASAGVAAILGISANALDKMEMKDIYKELDEHEDDILALMNMDDMQRRS